jgi:hypothetical protein
MGSPDTGIDTTLLNSTPMSTGVADYLAMFQAAVSIIIVYTQADTVQPAYTGTQTDLIIFVAADRFRFIQLGSSGE